MESNFFSCVRYSLVGPGGKDPEAEADFLFQGVILTMTYYWGDGHWKFRRGSLCSGNPQFETQYDYLAVGL